MVHETQGNHEEMGSARMGEAGRDVCGKWLIPNVVLVRGVVYGLACGWRASIIQML